MRLNRQWLAALAVLSLCGCATEGGDAPRDAITTQSDASSTATTTTTFADLADGEDVPLIDPEIDTDGDAIKNGDEGSATNRDSDGDGTPDYLDDDSDDDGISDLDEAGDGIFGTPPVDSDGDGLADFIDEDSDNNGIDDGDEPTGDLDGDGVTDRLDLDDDGDGVNDAVEIRGDGADCDGNGVADPGGLPQLPRDCDGDSVPDYRDFDSDSDGIPDALDVARDTDGDGWFDRYDLDTDNDGYPDADEAGDDDLETPPRDTDGDMIPDFRDPDSDDDGLPDQLERENGLDPYLDDADDDGASDLIEFAAGTDPFDETDNPRANGDFIFVVPWQEPSEPAVDTLEFGTSIRSADLYLAFDTTPSMLTELNEMRNPTTGLTAVVDALRCPPTMGTCVDDRDCADGSVCAPEGICVQDPLAGPNVCVPEIFTGVGRFDELDTYRNVVSLQADEEVTRAAIPGTFVGDREAPVQAVACVANGNNCNNSTKNCTPGSIGCPAYRPGAIRVLIQITDADNQCEDTCGGCRCDIFSTQMAGGQLAQNKIRFVGLYGTDDDDANVTGTPAQMLRLVGQSSGTLDVDGNAFAFEAIDTDIVPSTLAALRQIVTKVPFEITLVPVDIPGDGTDARRFVEKIKVNLAGTPECPDMVDGMPIVTQDSDGDGFQDSFPALLPGVPICFDVEPIPVNDIVEHTSSVQLFEMRLEVRGDDSALSSRAVYFLVPPAPIFFN